MKSARIYGRWWRILCAAGIAVAFLLAADSAQALFVLVSNRANNGSHGDNITRYDFDTGQYLGVFASMPDSHPYTMAADSSGNVYVSYLSNNTLNKFDRYGTSLGALPIAGFYGDSGLSIHDNYLYISSYYDGTVKKYGLDGSYIGLVGTIDNNGAQGMAWDASGNLLVADYNGSGYMGTIRAIAPGGAVSTFADLGGYGYTPSSLAIDSAGYVYASDSDVSRCNIRKFTSTGVDTGLTMASGQRIFGMTIANDVIYAVSYYDQDVRKYATDGTYLGVFTSTGLNDAEAGIVIIVPEPGSFSLIVVGVVALAGVRRRRNS